MRRAALAGVVLLACAPAGGGEPGRRPAPAQEVRMERLGDEVLKACGPEGESIALVLVRGVTLHAAGSRSEHVKADLAVEETLCGSLPATLVAWSFTSRGDTKVAAGHRYVMAVGAAQGYARFGIGPFVEVPPGREAEAVELHRRALAALGRGK